MSEALVIAQNYKDKTFVDFCKSEIIGWDTKKLPKNKSLDYRLILAYCTISQKINPNYIGWGETPSAMFSYMKDHPDDFFPRKFLVTEPLSVIEQKIPSDTQKSFASWTQSTADFFPDAKQPHVNVYCYADASTYRDVIEAIRTELTKRLLNLLPDTNSSWQSS